MKSKKVNQYLSKISYLTLALLGPIAIANSHIANADDWNTSFNGANNTTSEITSSGNNQSLDLTNDASIGGAVAGTNNTGLSINVGPDAIIDSSGSVNSAIDGSNNGSQIISITNYGIILSDSGDAIHLSGYNASSSTTITNDATYNQDFNVISSGALATNTIYINDNNHPLVFVLNNQNEGFISSSNTSDSEASTIKFVSSNAQSSFTINNSGYDNLTYIATTIAPADTDRNAIDLSGVSKGTVTIISSDSANIRGRIKANTGSEASTVIKLQSLSNTEAILGGAGKLTINISGGATVKDVNLGTNADSSLYIGAPYNDSNHSRVIGDVIISGQNVTLEGGKITGSISDISSAHSSVIEISGTAPANIGSIISSDNGRVGTIKVNSGSILNVNSNYTQNANSTLSIGLVNNITGTFNVIGDATLGGTLEIIPDNISYQRGTTYSNIITSTGTITGNFSHVTNGNPNSLIDFEVSDYGTKSVSVKIPLATNYLQAASTYNERKLATTLDSLAASTSSGDFNNTLNSLLNLDKPVAKQALDQLNNNLAHATTYVVITSANAVLNGIKSHIKNDIADNKFSVNLSQNRTGLSSGENGNNNLYSSLDNLAFWFQGLGDSTRVNSTGNTNSQTINSAGAIFGIENKSSAGDIIGVAFSAINSQIGTHRLAQSANSNSYIGSIYKINRINNIIFDGSLLGSYNNTDTRRYINFLNQTAKATSDGYSAGADVGVGYDIKLAENTKLTPRVGLNYLFAHQDSYSETGAEGANLDVNNINKNILRSSIGTDLVSSLNIRDDKGNSSVLIPQAYVGWSHNFLNSDYRTVNSFSGVNSSSFETRAKGMGDDSLDLKLGTSYSLSDYQDVKIYMNYGSSIYSNALEQNVNGGVKLSW